MPLSPFPKKTLAKRFNGRLNRCFFTGLFGSALLIVPGQSQSAEANSKQKTIQVRVVVLGQPVPPRYEIVKRVRIEELKGSDPGSAGDNESLPAQDSTGVPLQIAPEPDELPPSPLYIKTGKSWTVIPVRENTASPKVSVPMGAEVIVATATAETDSNGKKKSLTYDPLGRFAVSEDQDGMLILIIKDPRQPLKWNIHRTIAVNTSWNVLPEGSFTILNASFLPLRGQVSGDKITSGAKFTSQSFRPKSDSANRVPYILEVQHPDNSWNPVVNSSTSLRDGSRIIAIPYAVVMPKTRRFASLMVIRDFKDQGGLELPKPEKKDGVDSTGQTP